MGQLTVSNGTGSGEYAAEATVTITANAAPAWQVFYRWTSSDSTIFASASSATTTITMPTKNTTVTATYEDIPATTFSVHFDANGGTGTMPDVKVSAGNSYTLPACGFTAQEIHYFDKWEIDGTQYDAGNSITVNTNIIAKAIWKEVEASGEATFTSEPDNNIQGIGDNAGGASDLNDALTDLAEAIAGEDNAHGVSVSMALAAEQDLTNADESGLTDEQKQAKQEQQAIQKEAESFYGTGEDVRQDFVSIGLQQQETDEQNNTTSKPLTETPKVLEIPLRYNLTGRYSPMVLRFHDTASGLRRLASRPQNYQNLDGCFYVDGFGINAVFYIYSSRFSTYAIATTGTESYTVFFEANGGSGNMDNQALTTNTATALAANAFTRGGYTFTGWNTKADGSGTAYADKGRVTLTDADLTLYAQWKENVQPSTNPSPSGGSSGGGGGGVSTYPVNMDATSNGTVQSSNAKASAGSKVTLTVTPDTGYKLDSIAVLDKNGNEVKLTENADGTYSFTMPAGKVTVTAVFAEAELEPTPTPTPTPTPEPERPKYEDYSDLEPGAWYQEGIRYALETGMMNGMGNGKFKPDTPTSRAMIVTMLWRMEGGKR